MQVSSARPTPQPVFNSFNLILKIETKEDAEKLRFIFNYPPIVDGLGMSVAARAVRFELDNNTPGPHGTRYDDFAVVMRRNITNY